MPPDSARNLAVRAASGLGLGGAAVGAAVAGWPYFHLLLAVAALAMSWEWSRICSGRGLGPAGLAGMASAVAAIGLAGGGWFGWGLAAAAAGAMAGAGIDRPRAAWRAAGVLYVSLPCLALLWIRQEDGLPGVLWLFATVWAADTGAYAVGRWVGGWRLAPRVSPGKTWAGLAGAIAAAGTAGALVAWIAAAPAPALVSVVSAGLGLVEQGGDLLESAYKRRFGVKDSGALVPGHGGILDRVDGLAAAALAAAGLAMLGGSGVLSWG